MSPLLTYAELHPNLTSPAVLRVMASPLSHPADLILASALISRATHLFVLNGAGHPKPFPNGRASLSEAQNALVAISADLAWAAATCFAGRIGSYEDPYSRGRELIRDWVGTAERYDVWRELPNVFGNLPYSEVL